MRSSREEIIHWFLSLFVLFQLLNGIPVYAQPPADTPVVCLVANQHLLFQEDTTAVTAKFISATRDGNFLIPGYYYPNNGINYYMPYLIKCSKEGNILWSKRYNSLGIYSSQWYTATRIKELANGDLLMTGQIVVPGTDDRRELALWRLDKNGNLIWGTSYESALWSNPITGATEVTGIQEDAGGNLYICGELRIFEAPKYAFMLKLDARGGVLWDKNFGSNSALAYGMVTIQNNIFLIGSIGPLQINPNLNTNVLWRLQLNVTNGETIGTKAWYADFGQQSSLNSFAFTNTDVVLLDNGQISVHGSANSDFQSQFATNPGTFVHSIIADFSPDFDFQSGIMLSSNQASNFYNTIATQQPNGRISYTRFADNGDVKSENVIFGSIQNNKIIKERIYQNKSRTSASVSNLLFFAPDEDVAIQSFWDQVNGKGGLEFFSLRDKDSNNSCNGRDTSLSFIQPYFMKQTNFSFDSVITTAFRQTQHNYIGVNDGNLSVTADCNLVNAHVLASPVVALDKDSVLCQGTSRELSAGSGNNQYVWNTGSTGPSLLVSDTGNYRVTVTASNGCTGSDSVHITIMATTPTDFLPKDTTICEFAQLTLSTKYPYRNYLWNDHSISPQLTVSQAGWYSLDVTDSNYCVGHDSILISQKQCLEGLFVPNAFTPNGDGRNDVFKAFVSGNLAGFRFTIYDRWGAKVFDTKTAGQGWDGTFHGVPAATGAFVWYCRYQLVGQPEKIKKGTVMLIR